MKLENKKDFLREIDNYEQTIIAIICFTHILRWDDDNSNFKDDSYYYIGRKMDTTNNNRIKPNNTVRPDLVVQINNEYGIVCEAKSSFPKNRNHWREDFEQLEKYDDDLIGWITDNEQINIIDLILLTHYSMRNYVNDYLDDNLGTQININRNFAVIVYSLVEQTESYFFLEKSFGGITNNEFDKRLHEIIEVPLEKVLPIYPPIKFNDVKPVIPYIMDILWNHIFSQYPTTEEFMEAEGKKVITITVNLKDIVNRLKSQFGPPKIEHDHRQREFPRTRWVKEAMEMFVKLNHANINENDNNEYKIKYKYAKITNPLETFINEIIEYNKEDEKNNKFIPLNNF